ncbi:hypothetical protein [Lysinibacillus sp. FSL W7-1291]|uniref:hypothetical protein n=1 Tax=Lysinibacillus sp. FSL W7-1291 TaxID=2954544 RepID=UPI00315AE3CB
MKGFAIFYDLANLNILLEIGLTPETSTVFEVMQPGKPVLTYGQQLTTLDGFSYLSLNLSHYGAMESYGGN